MGAIKIKCTITYLSLVEHFERYVYLFSCQESGEMIDTNVISVL